MLTSSLSCQNRRQAFTLTEAAIVLGVVGIVMAAIWGAASSVASNKNINKAVEDQAMIVQNMRSLYKSRPMKTGTANFTELMMKAEIFPPSMIIDGKAFPQTAWGTDVKIEPSVATRFEITYLPPLPTEVCAQLIARAAGPNRDRGLTKIDFGGGGYTTSDQLSSVTATTVPACTRASFNYNIQG
ncbi:MAG: type 4 pilus major pilin [Bdellovibrionales bacterium]|jgi:type II secretory pathway pseudopilin PulG